MKHKSTPHPKPARRPRAFGIPTLRYNVAGIDVGSKQHFVCAPAPHGSTEIRVFDSSTPDLLQLLHWLQQSNVVSAALESTGAYWIPLFQLLDSNGIEVILADKKLPGQAE